jgi:ABC-2 type transport system ATP-binding protein
MNESIISIAGLWHKYQKHWAIQDITLDVQHNGIYGLLGSNGAGKSTLMNILCGVMSPTQGTVRIQGFDIRQEPLKAKKFIGFLPQQPPLLKELTVRQYLTHAAHLRFITPKEVPVKVNEALAKCQLEGYQNRMIKNLSGGFQQRVGIAQAIIHDPAFVVLDEPTNGLDPIQILEIRKLIQDIATERTVILSTHILQEVQALCDTIWLLNDGKVRFNGTLAAFNGSLKEAVYEVVCMRPLDAEQALKLPGVIRIADLGSYTYQLTTDGTPETAAAFVSLSVRQEWGLIQFAPEQKTLERVFSSYTQKEDIPSSRT